MINVKDLKNYAKQFSIGDRLLVTHKNNYMDRDSEVEEVCEITGIYENIISFVTLNRAKNQLKFSLSLIDFYKNSYPSRDLTIAK